MEIFLTSLVVLFMQKNKWGKGQASVCVSLRTLSSKDLNAEMEGAVQMSRGTVFQV